jgi:hypothetical protein
VGATGAGGSIRGHQGPVAAPRPHAAARPEACVEGSEGGGNDDAWWRWWQQPKTDWVERGNGKGKEGKEKERAVSKSAYVRWLPCHRQT